LEAVQSGQMSQRRASAHFKICRSTVKNKFKKKFAGKPGHPNVFTEEEEKAFASHIHKILEYGFPADELDLRFIVKAYLTRQGRIVKSFKENLPGRDWMKLFLKRHPELTVCFAANIKKVRAGVTENIISDYVDNLKVLVENFPPENIYNYNETNVSDDPGRKRIICRRGCKYPERILDSTKSGATVMFC
jgi:hypothetical protein